MAGTTGTIPLQTVIQNQRITPTLWNGEFENVGALLDAAGCGGHSDTDSDAQIQTAPYPGSVLSKATSIAGEIERIRYQLAAILGKTYWYQPAANGNNLGNIFLTGEVRALATATIPSGFLECDGSSYLRTDYAGLFAAIGTTWGSIDGTHFNVPDYRGRALLGAGTGSGLTARSLGQTGGEETHQLTTAELAAHNHGITDAGHTHAITDPTHNHGARFVNTNPGTGSTDGISDDNYTKTPGNRAITYTTNNVVEAYSTGITINSGTTGVTVNNNGSDTAHNNMQPWACVKYIIKT